MLFIDTETCGLHGMPVLLQYAEDDGSIILYDIWKKSISETLELIEYIAEQESVWFNLSFDWFHIAKCYTTFSLYHDYSAIPGDIIEELAILEKQACASPFCLKPRAVLDLMLHSRKGKYQSLMNRADIKIRRVPTRLSMQLCAELEKRIQLDGIYFARRKDQSQPHWQIRDVHLPNGDINPDFKDIVLKFSASGALKTLAVHALGIKEDLILKFTDIEVDKHWRPKEYGWAPFALAIGKPGKWKGAWPEVVRHHIDHWYYSKLARKYAAKDVEYTRSLYHFFGKPEFNDTDSVLAAMVSICRWKGFAIDIPKLKEQRLQAIKAKKNTPTSPNGVKGFLGEVMDDLEKLTLQEGTGVLILESIAQWKDHKAAVRAQEVIDARKAIKEIENFDKLILAGRFHADFKIIGTKSSRMSGTSGLNAQGIKATTEVRSCFPLADNDFILSGGDFDSFEIIISEAVYDDPKLRSDLTTVIKCTCGGNPDCKICDGKGEYIKKIHTLFAMILFDMSYEEVMETRKTDDDKYHDGKTGVYAMNYGGSEFTLQTRIGVSEEVAVKGYENFAKRYPGIGKARERIKKKFCSMTQPGGIGSAVIWKDPVDYIESLLGFKRFFTLENKIAKELFDLAQNPPASWKIVKIKLRRRERLQTASGACQSALYASAFGIQAANMRAGANHEIQSTGAGITKETQRKIWDIQPHGIHPWLVQPINIHDEIMVPCAPSVVDKVAEAVDSKVKEYIPLIPLIKMDWNKELKSWANK